MEGVPTALGIERVFVDAVAYALMDFRVHSRCVSYELGRDVERRPAAKELEAVVLWSDGLTGSSKCPVSLGCSGSAGRFLLRKLWAA